MRILVATRIYAPEAGAAAYRLAATVRALVEGGHDVTVLTTRTPGNSSSSTRGAAAAGRAAGAPGAREARLKRWPVLRDRTGAVRGYVQYASFDLPLFFRLLAAGNFDAVLVEPPPTTGVVVRVASWLRRRPYIYFAADVSSNAAAGIGVNPMVVKVLRAVEKWVLSGAAGVLSVSSGVSDAVRDLTDGRAAVTEVGTGIDTDTFALQATERQEVAAGPANFVYAGTMSEIQGAGVFVDGFLKILDSHPEARLLMYGQGVELEELKRRAAPAGNRIRFMGVAGGEEIAAAMSQAAAGLASVRPARGYDFAFATKAFASLACGAPVIYSGVGPLRPIVAENSLGHSVDWDSGAVAAAMSEVLEQPADQDERRRLARWVEQNYSLRSVGHRAADAVASAAGRDRF